MMALKAGRFILKYEVIKMILFALGIFTDTFLKQLRDKKDYVIKGIDNAAQAVSDLKCANKDITFNDLADFYLHVFESTVNTISTAMSLTGLYEMLADDDDLIMEITHDKDLIRFLSEHIGSIKDYKTAREVVSKWIK